MTLGGKLRRTNPQPHPPPDRLSTHNPAARGREELLPRVAKPRGAGGGGLGPCRAPAPPARERRGHRRLPAACLGPIAPGCGLCIRDSPGPGPASPPGGTERAGPGRAAPASPGDTHPRPATPPEAPTRKAIRGHAGQDGGAQAVRGEGGGSSVAAMSAARRCSPPRALAGTAARGAERPRRGLGVEGDRVRRWARPAGWGGQGRAGLTPGLWVVPGAALYR